MRWASSEVRKVEKGGEALDHFVGDVSGERGDEHLTKEMDELMML